MKSQQSHRPLPFCAAYPAVIAPLTCASVAEVEAVDSVWFGGADASLDDNRDASPDALEWRVDAVFAAGVLGGSIGNFIAEVAHTVCERSALPVVLTARSVAEGGACPTGEYARVVTELTRVAGQYKNVAVDIEIERAGSAELIKEAESVGVPVVASFHDFAGTPTDLSVRVEKMEAATTSAIKIAVTPHSVEDVLEVLTVCNRVAAPIIAIAMGRLGAVTRLMGAEFGSAATFVAGPSGATAPGQYTVSEVRQVLTLLG